MAATVIGRINSGGGQIYEVSWDAVAKAVYVRKMGGSIFGEPKLRAGTASKAGDAMRTAEAYLYNKR